jgi:hypothetical protein
VLITYSDAVKLLGLRSRNSLYRKIDSGDLQRIDTPEGPRLESEGLPERWAQITRVAVDSPRKVKPAPIEKRLQHPAPRPTEAVPDYHDSRARSEFEKANLLELDRKAKEALLLPTDQVEKVWANAVTIARTKLLAIPTRARQRIPHLSLEEVAIVEALIRETLEDLSSGE